MQIVMEREMIGRLKVWKLDQQDLSKWSSERYGVWGGLMFSRVMKGEPVSSDEQALQGGQWAVRLLGWAILSHTRVPTLLQSDPPSSVLSQVA